MNCPYCGVQVGEAAYCPSCGASLFQVSAAQREPAAVSVLRAHLSAKPFLLLIVLTAVQTLLQFGLSFADLGRFHLTVNNEPSPVGSAIFTLLICLPILWALWKTRSTALAGEGVHISAGAFILGKILAILALIFLVLLAIVTVIVVFSLLQTGPDAMIQDMPELMEALVPEEARSTLMNQLVLLGAFLALLTVYGFVAAISLLRCSSAAKAIAKQGINAKLSKLCAVTLMVTGGLVVLSGLLNLSSRELLPLLTGLATDLLLGVSLILGGLLTLRCRRDLDQAAAAPRPKF